MKTRNKVSRAALVAAALFTLAWAGRASAITIDMVTVGDAGNAGDTVKSWDGSSGHGAVSYEYQIGKYAVTNGQYAAFLNAVDPTGANSLGLYNSYAGSSVDYGYITWNSAAGKYETKAGWDNKPVVFVSFYDAARFTNWLTTGDTESGLYTFESGSLTSVGDHASAGANTWAIASEDEWYKAAYYNGNDTYRKYAVTGELSQTTANYGNLKPGGDYIADVNYFDAVTGASSFYGTYQQSGNVWEWTEGLASGMISPGRAFRGGSYSDYADGLESSAREYDGLFGAEVEFNYIGFRVVLLSSLDGPTVPEPSELALAMGVLMLGVGLWKRRGAM